MRKEKDKNGSAGFTLLEVLVALAILGIAITVVLQLFSSNLRAISASEDYLSASAEAMTKMREILDQQDLAEDTWTEVTPNGYRIEISVANALSEKTENLEVKLLEVSLTLHWTNGSRERALTLKTMKVVPSRLNI